MKITPAQPYLHGGGPEIPPRQHPATLQPGHAGVLHLQEVAHEPRDVHLPIRAQEKGLGISRVGLLVGREARQHPQHGVLELEHAALPPLVLLVLAAPARPGV